MFSNRISILYLIYLVVWVCMLAISSNVSAGDYIDSAHGSAATGVFRSAIGNPPPMGFGYSRGNCSHCHETHHSIAGSEPLPASGQASPHTLFSDNFNSTIQTNPYSETDNFCFFCHNNPASAQSVVNYDYSHNFGCASQGATTIKSVMNQVSYHNLYDIWNFSKGRFSWFSQYSNPCSACHNSHLAKRNWINPRDPAFSAISKPTDHFTLWGTTETMAGSYNTKYEPPYCSSSHSNREPDAIADASAGRAATPNYVEFCTVCHTTTNSIYSTSLNRNLLPIDWGSTGDKHGLRTMDGSVSTTAPYDTSGGGTDLVLSCLDCHEPHGSENNFLLRRRVNGSDVADTITSLDNTDWGLLCVKCHIDDDSAETGDENKWEYVHHLVSDAPYLQTQCDECHSTITGGEPISCQNCHNHGGEVTKADSDGIFRIGF